MKRNGGVLAFLIIMFSSLVTAGPVQGIEQLAEGLREVVVIIIRFIGDMMLDINSFDEFLFAKLLLFTLVLIVTYTVIKQNTLFGGNKNKPIQWIISSAIAILAIRYLPDNFVQAILLQYGALAVGLTVFLPLTIYFFFIHQSGIGPFGRRAGWIVFATSFFALWSFRYEDLGSVNWIYWIAIGFVIISMIFDKSIHRYFSFADFRKMKKRLDEKTRYAIEDELDAWRNRLEKGQITVEKFQKESRELQERIKALS